MNLSRPLNPVEARVLATLMEKARTVPDTYPLSLNLVVTGCNQKTSREPVMHISDAQAQEALDALRGLGLVLESHGTRVARYAHNAQRTLGVPDQAAALLGLLMLRGPQTAAELRINAERWHRFADTSSVEGFLNELAERPEEKGGPLAVLLPRAPGERECRWAHLLCGPVSAAQASESLRMTEEDGASTPQEFATLSRRVQTLEAEVAQLRSTVDRLCAELGLAPGSGDAHTASAAEPAHTPSSE